jgi:hypothetical protein
VQHHCQLHPLALSTLVVAMYDASLMHKRFSPQIALPERKRICAVSLYCLLQAGAFQVTDVFGARNGCDRQMRERLLLFPRDALFDPGHDLRSVAIEVP